MHLAARLDGGTRCLAARSDVRHRDECVPLTRTTDTKCCNGLRASVQLSGYVTMLTVCHGSRTLPLRGVSCHAPAVTPARCYLRQQGNCCGRAERPRASRAAGRRLRARTRRRSDGLAALGLPPQTPRRWHAPSCIGRRRGVTPCVTEPLVRQHLSGRCASKVASMRS